VILEELCPVQLLGVKLLRVGWGLVVCRLASPACVSRGFQETCCRHQEPCVDDVTPDLPLPLLLTSVWCVDLPSCLLQW
jgi:hypothetical protein